MIKLLYLNIAAIPVYVLVMFSTFYRKMTRGRTNILFILLTAAAFFTVASELAARVIMWDYPLSHKEVVAVKISEYVYFVMRHATNFIYLYFIFSVTRTWFRIRQLWKKLVIAIPFIAMMILLLVNERFHFIFLVTPEDGYMRSENIIIAYILAAIYVVFGISYLISCRKTLDIGGWIALMAMYILNLIAVIIQFFNGKLLIECYFTSMSLLFVILFVQRPEKQVDILTGLAGYGAFREEILKINTTGQKVKITIAQIRNADEIKRYLGDDTYYDFVHEIGDIIYEYSVKEGVHYELFFEHPGTFYVIMDDAAYNPVSSIPTIRERIRHGRAKLAQKGAAPDVRIVTVSYPDEIDNFEEILQFGHNFSRFADVDRVYSHASDIIAREDYNIEAHLDEILDRAIEGGNLQISYKPFMRLSDRRFASAEARMSLYDEQFGQIDTHMLEIAAEEKGQVVRLGDYVLEKVFAFVGSSAFLKSGYEYIDVNLSVLQCMQINFTDRIWALREKYEVHPENICIAFKESVYENMSSVLDENIRKLSMQGYRFALDGYGNGYSNMHYILELPIRTVRLDEQVVRGATTEAGKAVLHGVIQMMKSIPLMVAGQGADDEETALMLEEMGCDIIQGEYYEKSLKTVDKSD